MPLALALVGVGLVVGFLLGLSVFWPKDPRDYGEGRRRVPVRAPYDAVPPSVRHEEAYWNGTHDGALLYWQLFAPVGREPKAVVCVCHGFGDTGVWFWRSHAAELVSRGFAVIVPDARGHGYSDGLHAYVPSLRGLAEELHGFFQDVLPKHFPGKPAFVMGESMGGASAYNIFFAAPSAYRGFVLLAPMIAIKDDMKPPQFVIDLMRIVVPLLPSWPIAPGGKGVIQVGFKRPDRRVEAYLSPGVYTKKLRLKTAEAFLNGCEDMALRLEQFTPPFLVLHGDADVVTDPALSRMLVERSASADKTLKIYPGAWHALICAEPEDDVQRIFEDITGWMDDRL